MANRIAVVGKLACLLLGMLPAACGDDSDTPQISADSVRAERRMYPGAPPVIPHAELGGAACISCHDEQGMAVEGIGFAPPMPHAETAGMGALVNCRQCHVPAMDNGTFRENAFAPVPPEPTRAAHEGAPPVIPHRVFMRENCAACHTGQTARESVLCSHPERVNCVQCHVESNGVEVFGR